MSRNREFAWNFNLVLAYPLVHLFYLVDHRSRDDSNHGDKEGHVFLMAIAVEFFIF